MRAVLLVVMLSVVLTACGPAPATVAGYVVDVKSTSLTQVDVFTIRSTDGELVTLRVGRLELDGGGFPAGHLREHMATNSPVAVGYREEGGEKIAYRLVDAPWVKP